MAKVTIEDLSLKLKQARFHNFMKQQDIYDETGASFKKGKYPNLYSPINAVRYFEKNFSFTINIPCTEEKAVCALFDLSHFPLDMILARERQEMKRKLECVLS